MNHPTPHSCPMADRYQCPSCGEVDLVQQEAAMVGWLYANDEHAQGEDNGTGWEYEPNKHGARCGRCGSSTWSDPPPNPDNLSNPESAELWRRPCTLEEAVFDCAEDIRQAESETAGNIREDFNRKELEKRWPGIAPHVLGVYLSTALEELIKEKE